jgi:type VI protein secretion system component VasF
MSPGDPLWLIIQRLDDVRREQDRLRQRLDDQLGELRQELRAEVGSLRQELHQRIDRVEQRIDRLIGWFIAGLVAVLAAVVGMGFAVR